MSRIGKKPVAMPDGVSMTLAGRTVKIKGPKGELVFDMPERVEVAQDDAAKSIVVTRHGDERQARAMHGMVRATLANMVEGVSKGFEKRLHVYGTGYGCSLQGRQLNLNCGFMGRGGKNKPQFVIDIPKGVEVEIEVAAARGDSEPAKMVIRGCDKHAVGQFASNIRRLRPPEPYKGKGIRYHDEQVRRKAGKAVTGAG
jgi:large subunit ribosomal protein L6